MRLAIVWLLMVGYGWAAPSSTPTPEAYKPSAKETDKPAIFGYMILARGQEQYGYSVKTIYRKSWGPLAGCCLILPLYLHLAGRRRNRRRVAQSGSARAQ